MNGAGGITPLEALLRRDRLWIGGGLLAIVALSWAWLVPAALDMQGGMTGLAAWMMAPVADARYLALLFTMWAVMMAGMMLPSAAPTFLLYGRVVRSNGAARAVPQVYAFAGGYLLAWSAFSGGATLLQWALREAALLTPMMRTGSTAMAGALLIVGGVYQWTPIKSRCLVRCQSPAAFISQQWRPGIGGALQMGFRHGLYCLGCCWALMLLLFVGGVMSLGWIAALTTLVLAEKLMPFGASAGRAAGAVLAVAGVVMLLRG